MKRLFLTILKEYFNPEGSLIRNSISFAIFMSTIPLIAITTVISIKIIQSTNWIIELLAGFIPISIINELIDVGLNTNNLGFIPFLVSIIISYYSASRGFYSIIVAFSYSQDKEESISLTLQSIIAPIIFITLLIILISINSAIKLLIPNISFILNATLSLTLYILLSMIFFITTNPLKPIKKLLPGATFFAISLTIISNLFFIYINNFANYQDIYGSLASIMIVTLSIKIVSSTLFIAHIINKYFYLC